MSEINLNDITKETFGARLPNVFIEQITVDYDDGLEDRDLDAIITAKLNIKFTKPAHLQHKTVENFIEEYMSDLYLYAYMPYQSNVYEKLQNNTFKMLEWMRYESSYVNASWRNDNNFKIALSTLIAEESSFTSETVDEADTPSEENIYGSKLVTNSSFDSEGNEIIEISNITLVFKSIYDSTLDPPVPQVKDVKHLLIIATVGHHAAPLRKAERVGDYESYFGTESDYPYSSDVAFDEGPIVSFKTTSHPSFFNRNFGNITYYHVLEYGAVSPRFYQVYTTPDGAAYYNQVLQSLNGKFYATDNYSFESIQAAFQVIIDKYESLRQGDPTLNNDISGLEAIIYAEKNKVNVLGEIANYRSIYPNKDQGTNSGLFYNDVIVTFAEVLQSVQAQTELSSKMLFDSLVIDKRSSLLSADGWTLPGFASNPIETRFPRYEDMVDSGNYIPTNWFNMTRKAFIRNSEGISDDLLKEIYGSYVIEEGLIGAGESAATEIARTVGVRGSDYDALYDKLLNEYRASEDRREASGFSADQAERLALEELDYQFSTGQTGRATDLLNPTMDDQELLDFFEGDIIVKNRGHFFFEYEKALRNKSNLSKLLQLEKLQKYFRINVPYEAFYFRHATLRRKELQIGVSSTQPVTNVLRVNFHLPNIGDPPAGVSKIEYPIAKDGYHQINTPSSFDFSDTSDNSRFKYGRPAVFIGGEKHTSFVKPVLFEIPTNNTARRLDNFNSLDSVLSWDEFSGDRIEVMDGYRLQMFQFVDHMDDDVAYYNTSLFESAERSDALASLNFRGHPGTCYEVEVRISDLTTNVYCDFLNTAISVYNDYLKYVGLAQEICSFNNITNSYNQFFIDKINEEYPNKPWIIAAYYAVGISDMLFGDSFAIKEETYRERVLQEVIKIAPETGNLEQTLAFARIFNTLLQYLSPEVTPLDADTESPVGTSTPGTSFDAAVSAPVLIFSNKIPIPSTIYGDVTPDLGEVADLFNVREPAPIPVPVWNWSADHRYVFRGTADEPDRILSPSHYSYEYLARFVYDRTFYHQFGGTTTTFFFPWGVDESGALTTGVRSNHESRREWFEANVRTRLAEDALTTRGGDRVTSTAGDGVTTTHYYTYASYIVNRIFRNFSTDVEMTADGNHGRRKPGGAEVANMRQYRTLNQLLYILEEYMRPECNRRVALGRKDIVDIGVHQYVQEGAAATANPTYYGSRVQGVEIPYYAQLTIEELIRYVRASMGLAIEIGYDPGTLFDSGIAAASAATGGGELGFFSVRLMEDSYKLYELVRAEDPEGSNDFNRVL